MPGSSASPNGMQQQDDNVECLDPLNGSESVPLSNDGDGAHKDAPSEQQRSNTTTTWKDTKKKRLNQDSLVFSTRISVALTLCSLFILLDRPDPSQRVYPDATWIYISTCIVMWLTPSRRPLDASSVVSQVLGMVMGSIVGAALSISCGFLAILIQDDTWRAVFMGCCIAVGSFVYCFLIVKYNLISSLSATLGLFEFAISLFPFLSGDALAWRYALFRVINCWIGCLISLCTSLLVFPRSTRWSLQQQLMDQVELAGDCARLVLTKACRHVMRANNNNMTTTTTRRNLTSLMEVTRRGLDPDETHEAYTAFIFDSFASDSLMDLLQYDCCRKKKSEALRMEANQISSQAFLVVATVIIMDSCVRHGVYVEQCNETMDRVGDLIKTMLSTSSSTAADCLLLELSPVRNLILQASKEQQSGDGSTISSLQELKDLLTSTSETMPMVGQQEQSRLFFLQLIEQLILQSLRLYYIWIQNKECRPRGSKDQVDYDSQPQLLDSPALGDDENIDGGASSEMRTSEPPLQSHKENADSLRDSLALTTNGDASTNNKVSKPQSHPLVTSSTVSAPRTANGSAQSQGDGADSESLDAESTDKNDRTTEAKGTATKEAMQFAIRMSVSMTLSSLFILLDSPDPSQRKYPQGAWVLVSAVVVSWYPNLDAASVVLKTVERMIGTTVAAIVGWICGLLAVLIQEDELRSLFLGFCNLIVTFVYSFVGFRSEVYNAHQYGSFVGLFTFAMVLFPFTGGDINAWWTGLYRFINTLIGALISCCTSLFIFPRSTKSMVQRRVTQQVGQAGVSVKSVLSDERSSETDDETYKTVLSEYKSSNELFYVLSVDPFIKRRDRKKTSQFRKEAALTLARVFRIQTTAMLLENNKPSSLSIQELFVHLGANIETMLMATEDANSVSDEVLLQLAEMQPLLSEARVRATESTTSSDADVTALREALCHSARRMPPACEECNEILCLLLVEHLVLRALRLYYVWRQNTDCTALV